MTNEIVAEILLRSAEILTRLREDLVSGRIELSDVVKGMDPIAESCSQLGMIVEAVNEGRSTLTFVPLKLEGELAADEGKVQEEDFETTLIVLLEHLRGWKDNLGVKED